ncbi:MAG TPA: MerR family DNA-binding protein [Variovorax sp.]|jgi:DNA-binding transcriptional MerR regulator
MKHRTIAPDSETTETTPAREPVPRPFTSDEVMTRAGVSERLLRHCESLGLIRDADHANPHSARYSHEDVSVLRFTRRAHAMGFGMTEVTELLSLWRNIARASSDVKHISLARIEDFELRIEELQTAKRTLERLTDRCPGSQRSECPILDELVDLRGFI